MSELNSSTPTPSEEVQKQLADFRADFSKLTAEVSKVIVGHEDIVEGTIMALIAGGHVLLEGVPGLGKTLLVRTLADALHLQFSRVQFTPDLMPADLIGTNVVMETPDGRREFDFQKGPVFSNIVLADEINRATPKTQSALLESMQEHSVTIGGTTHKLPQPFLVLATQNPLEMEGTYPLPEAQLDRFFQKLLVPFPTSDEIAEILQRTTEVEIPEAEAVLEGDRILEMRALSRQIPIADEVRQYAIALVLATHPDQEIAPEMVKRFVRYGSSPRGAQALILGAKIKAILDSRYHVSRDDIRSVAHATLRHRMILNFEGQAENVFADDVIDNILATLGKAALVAS
ncbi:MAG: AAA family ATPase [Planctomycetaceae bacterium]|nr:AAA family ATPase [Planctomycetaceae bacterium]